jgi:predicted enzyme related to lactoylglutathione lyase
MPKHGYFHWNELMTRDVEKARAFFSDCIGWKFTSMQMDEGPVYWMAIDGETPLAGMFEMSGTEFEGMPDHWLSYIAVDDVDACVERARKNGATIMREPFDIPGTGRIALLQQPGGAAIGWMTPAN